VSPDESDEIVRHASRDDLVDVTIEENVPPPVGARVLLELPLPPSVRICGRGHAKTLEELLGSPRAEHIRSLELFAIPLGDDGLARLAENPRLRELRELSIRRAKVGPKGLTALAKRATFARLEQLEIDAGRATRASASALAKAPFATALRSLWLHRATDEAVSALLPLEALVELDLSSPDQPAASLSGEGLVDWLRGSRARLRQLVADGSLSPTGDAILAAIAGNPAMAGLEELRLIEFAVGKQGPQTLAASPHPIALRRLAIEQSDAYDEHGLLALLSSPVTASLASLDLGGLGPANLGPKVAQAAVRPSLTDINLSSHSIGDAGAEALGAGTLVRLAASSCKIGPTGVRALVRGGARLEYLDLFENPLGDEGLETLAEARLDRLMELNVSSTNATTAGLTALLRAPWPALKALHLMYNRGIDASGLALLKASSLAGRLEYLRV
jgi:hypothetical protein